MGNLIVYPSPKSTYDNLKSDPTLILIPKTPKTYKPTRRTISGTEPPRDSSTIPCRYIPSQNGSSPYLIIYFHGNSEDIGYNLSCLLLQFQDRFAMNVLCPEYPTYGIYKKKDESLSMEEAMIQDARQVVRYCHSQMKFSYEKIILIGRSLGTGVVTQIANEFKVRGAILISPFTSIREVAKQLVGNMLSKVVPDVFRSIDHVQSLEIPLLFIHGKQDALIPHSMSKRLYEKAQTQKKAIILNDIMTHNEFKMEMDIFLPIHAFMRDHMDLKEHLALFIEEFYEYSEDIMKIRFEKDVK